MHITLIGGPTALPEMGGLRLLTDPTFDPPGSQVTRGPVTLRKTVGPALTPDEVGAVDAVLLSHDQHFDNLDATGWEFLARAGRVFTTVSGAERLGSHSVGLAPWQSATLTSRDGEQNLRITATPARHGPPGIEPISGEVVGFVLQRSDYPEEALYVTGDTVWYEGVADVARRFPVKAVLLFAGAARVAARGPEHLTMDHKDAVATARAFPHAVVLPVHHDGWEHFTESVQDLVEAYDRAGLSSRLFVMQPGVAYPFDLADEVS